MHRASPEPSTPELIKTRYTEEPLIEVSCQPNPGPGRLADNGTLPGRFAQKQ